MTSIKETLLRRWLGEVWCQGDLDLIGTICATDAVMDCDILTDEPGQNDLKVMITALRSLASEIDFRLTHVIEEGNLIAGRHIYMIKGHGSDEVFETHGQTILRVEDGLIREVQISFDFLRLFEKLGQIPPDALPICMTGQRLRWDD